MARRAGGGVDLGCFAGSLALALRPRRRQAGGHAHCCSFMMVLIAHGAPVIQMNFIPVEVTDAR